MRSKAHVHGHITASSIILTELQSHPVPLQVWKQRLSELRLITQGHRLLSSERGWESMLLDTRPVAVLVQIAPLWSGCHNYWQELPGLVLVLPL